MWELQQKHMVIAINKIVYIYIIGEYLFIDDIIQFEIFKTVIDTDNIVYPDIILPHTNLSVTFFLLMLTKLSMVINYWHRQVLYM